MQHATDEAEVSSILGTAPRHESETARGSGAIGPRSWAVVAAAMFACGWGGNQFTPLLLLYRRLAGYSELSVDAFLGAYVVGLVPGLLLAGPISDRRGRRPVLVAGTAASAAASLVLAFGALGPWPIYAGRLLTGVAVGIAMAVGTSWVKELSPGTDPGIAARRASLCQTVGFGLGAGVAGALAQWGPMPMVTPYVVHIAITVSLPLLLLRVPETRGPHPAAATDRGVLRSLMADLRVPAAGRVRFRRVVLPMAPWLFAAAALAYAVMPQLVDAKVGRWGLAYATLLTVLTLGSGAAVQPLSKKLSTTGRWAGRTPAAAMAVVLLGVLLCAVDSVLRSPWLAVAAALTLGIAFGVGLISGLIEVQRMANPDDLAGLTGVYFAVAYAGFLLPTVLAALSVWFSYPVMLDALAVLALACLARIVTGVRGGSTVPG
jgi:MFS family permease